LRPAGFDNYFSDVHLIACRNHDCELLSRLDANVQFVYAAPILDRNFAANP
jgi:hypothetical protein